MLYAYCDGSIEGGNPGGWGVAGFVIKDAAGATQTSGAVSLGQYESLTNNFVEYTAVAAALRALLDNAKVSDIVVRTDSQLVVKQLNGEYQISKETLIPLRDEILELAKSFKSVKYEWIPREENTEADTVSRSLYPKEN